MMAPDPSAYIWIAAGHLDMRRDRHGLSVLVQASLFQNPFSGHVFAFRGQRGDLIKMVSCKALRPVLRGAHARAWAEGEFLDEV